MFLFKFCSLIFFLNLYNSFTFTSYKLNKSINKSKFLMGCDYYIEKNLHVYYYNKENYDTINIKRERGCYYDTGADFSILDALSQLNMIAKDKHYLKKEKLIKYHLKPRMIPYLIYSQNEFNNEYLTSKYKEIIESKLFDNKEWCDVEKILMVEERYEKDKK